MAFNIFVRQARDTRLLFGRRWGAFSSCMTRHAEISGQTFTAVRVRFLPRCASDPKTVVTEAELTQALDNLLEEREGLLTHLAGYAAQRHAEKARGLRVPPYSQVEAARKYVRSLPEEERK